MGKPLFSFALGIERHVGAPDKGGATSESPTFR